MRRASYVPAELIPLPLSGSIPELRHVAEGGDDDGGGAAARTRLLMRWSAAPEADNCFRSPWAMRDPRKSTPVQPVVVAPIQSRRYSLWPATHVSFRWRQVRRAEAQGQGRDDVMEVDVRLKPTTTIKSTRSGRNFVMVCLTAVERGKRLGD
jgi:hypothetical protein